MSAGWRMWENGKLGSAGAPGWKECGRSKADRNKRSSDQEGETDWKCGRGDAPRNRMQKKHIPSHSPGLAVSL